MKLNASIDLPINYALATRRMLLSCWGSRFEPFKWRVTSALQICIKSVSALKLKLTNKTKIEVKTTRLVLII